VAAYRQANLPKLFHFYQPVADINRSKNGIRPMDPNSMPNRKLWTAERAD